MATGTSDPLGRQTQYQMLHFLRKAVAFNTTGIATADTVKMPNRIPAGAEIVFAKVKIVAAFNAVTTNVLTVGTSAGSDADIVGASDLDEATIGATIVYRGAGLTFSAGTEIYVKYTQTGTAATAGSAIIIVAYAPNNDA